MTSWKIKSYQKTNKIIFCAQGSDETQEHLQLCGGTSFERRGLDVSDKRGLLDFWRRMKMKLDAVTWGTINLDFSVVQCTHYISCWLYRWLIVKSEQITKSYPYSCTVCLAKTHTFHFYAEIPQFCNSQSWMGSEMICGWAMADQWPDSSALQDDQLCSVWSLCVVIIEVRARKNYAIAKTYRYLDK